MSPKNHVLDGGGTYWRQLANTNEQAVLGCCYVIVAARLIVFGCENNIARRLHFETQEIRMSQSTDKYPRRRQLMRGCGDQWHL